MSFRDRSVFRRVAAAAAALLLALGLNGCGIGPQAVLAEPDTPNAPAVPSALPPEGRLGYRVLCTLPNLNSQTLTMLARGVQDYCDYLGIDLSMHNSHDDHLAQAVEIDAFVAAGGQAVLCSPVDAAALQPFLQVARQQGVFLVTWGENADANAALTLDWRAAGSMLGADAAAWAQRQEVAPQAVLLTASGSLPGFTTGVNEGFAAGFPDAEVTVPTLVIQEESLAEDLLAMDPAPAVILADSDAGALLARESLAAYWAQEQPEEPPPDWSLYYFGGYGASLEGLAALQAGELQATIGENGYEAGRQMVDMAVLMIQGGTVETTPIDFVLVDKAGAAGYN